MKKRLLIVVRTALSVAQRTGRAASQSRDQALPAANRPGFSVMRQFGRTRRLEQRIAEMEAAADRRASDAGVAIQELRAMIEDQAVGFERALTTRLEAISRAIQEIGATTDALQRVAEALPETIEARVLLAESGLKSFAVNEVSSLITAVSLTEERLAFLEKPFRDLEQQSGAFFKLLEERVQIAELNAKSFAADRLNSLELSISRSARREQLEQRIQVAELSAKAFASERAREFERSADERIAVCEAHVLAHAASAINRLSNEVTALAQRTEFEFNELVQSNSRSLLALSRESEARAIVAEAGAKAYANSGLGALGASIGASNRVVLGLASQIDKVIEAESSKRPPARVAKNGTSAE